MEHGIESPQSDAMTTASTRDARPVAETGHSRSGSRLRGSARTIRRHAAVWLAAATIGVLPAFAASPPTDRGPAPAAAGAIEPNPDRPGGIEVALPDVVGGYASDRVILQLAPGVESRRVDAAWTLVRDGITSEASASVFVAAGVVSIQPLFRRGFGDPVRAAAFGLDRYRLVEVPRGSDVPAIVAAFHAALAAGGLVDSIEADGIGGVAGDAPNDPLFPTQWALENTGQTVGGVAGLPGADISALEAWTRTTGAGDVVVAVLDSGINPHPEFAARILPGWNVPDDSDFTEDLCGSHGTSVSGVLAAGGDDGIGIAGIDWTVRLLPIVVVDPCSGPESYVAEALVFATDAGADIANMSLQYFAGTTALRNAVLYADAAGVLMVAATGNNSANTLAYPAAWPETIAVGASNNLDGRWASSNTGPGISLLAPGVTIRTTSGFASYTNRTGTSFAVPHVSATASLMLSIDPWLDAAALRARIEASADDVPPTGYDEFTGFGRLNAGAAVLGVPIPGDLDQDGRVNGVDLAELLSRWGICPEGEVCSADIDRSGAVDGVDLAIALSHWTG